MDPEDKSKPADAELEDPTDDADTDDLPVADLPSGLVKALKDAGVNRAQGLGQALGIAFYKQP